MIINYLFLFFFFFFQFAMCRITNQIYEETMDSLLDSSWTEFAVNLVKWTCWVGNQICVMIAYNFAENMLQYHSDSSYVFSSAAYLSNTRASAHSIPNAVAHSRRIYLLSTYRTR